MATLSQQQDDKDNQTQQQGGNTAVAGAGGSPQAPSTSRVASYSNGAAPAQGSGRFTNLKTYVDANKGAGDQLGSKLTNNLNQQVTKASDQTQAQQIGQKVQAEKDRLAEGTQFNQQLQDRQTDQASQIAGNADTSGRFSNLLNNQNVASNLNTEYQTAQSNQINALNTAQQNVNNLGTEQGRFQLLQNTVKNPNYTTGQQRLDQLFLQTGNPNDLLNAQRDLGKTVGQNAKQLEGVYGQLGTGISEADKQAVETAALLRGTLGSETNFVTDEQRKKAEAANTSGAAGNTAIDRFFTGGYSSLDDAQKAIIDPMLASGNLTQGMRTYNVLKEPQSYKNYVSEGSTNLTSNDVINEADFNRYSALAKLAEQDPNSRLFTGVGSGGTQAGIKGQELATDISTQKTALDTLLNNQYSFGSKAGYGLTHNASSNYLDLLKYLEAGKSGNIATVGDSPIAATNGKAGANTDYDIGSNVGRTINLDPWNTSVNAGAKSSRTAADDLVADFLAKINGAGYTNKLG